ncbi:hypothetical protein G9A89_007011 [Geosiphon pyriformis]|nr:hypothetical protein G9A89_007011 [Geosiphon pyriformis]
MNLLRVLTYIIFIVFTDQELIIMASTPESTEEAVSATNTTTEGTITIIENDIKTKTPDFDLSRIDALPVELPDKKNDTEPEKKPTVSFFQLFRYASPWDKILILIGSIGAMANGCALPFMTIIFANFIQAFGVFALATRTHPDDLQDAKNTLDDEVRKNVYHFLILGSSAFVASYVQMTCWMIAGENQTKRIRELYYASTMKQNIAWFDKMSTGDITTRISADTSILQEGISEKIGLILQYSTTFVAGFIIGFTKSWKLALVVCCVIPLLAAAGGAMAKALSSSTTKGQDAYAGAGTVAEQALSSIRTVVAFGGEKREIQRYLQQLETAYRSGTKKGLIGGLGLGLIFLILFSTYGLGFWYGSKLVLNGEKTGGQVLNTFFSLIMGAFSLGNAAPHFSAIGNAMGSAAALFAVIDRVPEIDVTSKEGKKLTVSSVKGRIEFKNINFHYPQRPDIPILKNFNLIVESGQTVALVGSSGSGKSTVVSLLERFYDPIDGQISLDDEDIKNINIKSLRSLIGLVGQEPVLFPQSIAQNIRWGGLPDEKEPTLDEIIESCKKSNAHEFIDELPDKYETLVGEKGALLSGGQKQRIAIARALIKDPPILLLDEATSALDTESERLVQDALDAAATNRTTIVIAHRLSTIKNADKIVVMRKGEIIEVGRHEELISNQGMYYELVKAQELKIQHDIEKFKEEADNSSDESVDDVTIDIEEKEKLVQKSLSRVKTNGTIISHKSEEQVRAEEEVAALKKRHLSEEPLVSICLNYPIF